MARLAGQLEVVVSQVINGAPVLGCQLQVLLKTAPVPPYHGIRNIIMATVQAIHTLATQQEVTMVRTLSPGFIHMTATMMASMTSAHIMAVDTSQGYSH